MEVKYRIIEITFVSQFRIHSLMRNLYQKEQNIDFLIKEFDEGRFGKFIQEI